jgi:glycosyltransferase involved in cell wall biosynthesis
MMPIPPLISVIVPIYNVEEYMDECVQSILSQTYSNLQIILVDDGSTDSCPQKCDVWAEKDARIQVLHKKNGGLSSARNAGLKVATGEFISFIDSDDFIDEHMYEKLIEGFSLGNNVAITSIRLMRYVNGSVSDFNKHWVFDAPRFIEGKDFLPMLIDLKCSNTVCDKLYRATLCRKVAFMEGRNNEDTLFNYFIGKELRKENSVLVEMPYSAYFYRWRPDSICTSTKKPLIFDTLSNYDFMLANTSLDDIELVEVLKKNKIYNIYLFLDLIILNKEQKQLYYNQFRGILKQFSYTEIKRALQPNDFVYALMHLYCPKIRAYMRKLLQSLGHYKLSAIDK